MTAGVLLISITSQQQLLRQKHFRLDGEVHEAELRTQWHTHLLDSELDEIYFLPSCYALERQMNAI